MVPFPTKAEWGGVEVWPGRSTTSTRSTKAEWGGVKVWPGRSTRSARKRISALAHLEPGTTKTHSRDSRRAIVDQRWASLPQRTTAKFLRTPTQLRRRRKRAHKVAKR